MGLSRRKRKRERQLMDAQGTGRRGDRPPPPNSGERGRCAGLWADATLAELNLLRKAIHQNWPVPADNRPGIIDEILRLYHHEATSTFKRLVIFQILLTMERANREIDPAKRE